ncbi:MAG: AAA family ATPase, partial [Myxococcales bacterium]|nr:AAA family ATPase [Myxococcales bacterium]
MKIYSLRSFEQARVEFVHPDQQEQLPLNNVTLLLGDNSAGKTTVLRAVALAALGPVLDQSGYMPKSMVRWNEGEARVEASIRVHALDRSSDTVVSDIVATTVTIERRGSRELLRPEKAISELAFDDESPAMLVLGYGATRRTEPPAEFHSATRRKLRALRYERVAGLFEDHLGLTPLEAWLPKLERDKPRSYCHVLDLFASLLPSDIRFTGHLERDEYVFERGHTVLGFSALSDGYRGFVGLLSDLFFHLCTGLVDGDDPRDSRGIVLI